MANGADRTAYKAFISYSHAADGRLAPALQSALQSFAKPWYRIRTFSVFRDDTNLSVTPALWPAIERALASSEFFILLASPEAAVSKWVRQEVEYWITNRSADKLLIVQTGGMIIWDDGAGDFAWPGTTAVPVSLAKMFDAEPFYLDLSWAKSPDEHLSLRHSDFRKAVLKLAATLSSRDMAALDSEEVRQHRKNIRVAWGAGVALLALTVIAVVAAFSFLRQKQEAERQRNTAFARQLAAESTAQLGEHPDLALLLSVEGLRTQSNIETRGGLLRALQHSPLLSTFLHGHTDIVRCVAVRPGGTVFATGGDDGNIILWDFTTRRQLGQPLVSNKGPVTSLAFSPDGRILASGNGDFDDSVLVTWDVETRQVMGEPLPGPGNTIIDLRFSSGGEILASLGGGVRVPFWEVKGGYSVVPPLEAKVDVTAVAFHPRAEVLAVGNNDGAVSLWNYRTRRQIGHELKANKNSVDELTFGKGGDLLAVGYHDGTLIIWDVKKQEPVKTNVGEVTNLEIMALDFSPDGDTVAAGFSDGTISLFSVASGKPVGGPLTGHRLAVGGVAFSPDGKALVSGGYDGNVIFWDLGARVPLGRRFDNFGGRQVETVAIDQGGRVVGATEDQNVVTLWDVETARPIGEALDGGQGEVSEIALEPRGRYLAAAYKNHKLIVWDTATGRPSAPVIEGHKSTVYSLAFSPDGKTLASSDDDGAIYLWEAATGRALGQPLHHGKGLIRMVFSPDGKTLVSGGEDGTIKFWDVTDGRPLGQTATTQDGAILCIAISPDGRTVATGGTAAKGSKVYLWDVGTRRALGEPLQGHRGPVQALAFSPDGAILASGAWDYRIVFWDTATRRPVGLALTGHEAGVESLLFEAGGKRLVSAAQDNTVIVWDVDVKSWEGRACRIANRNLTCAEWAQFFTDTRYHPTCPDMSHPQDCL